MAKARKLLSLAMALLVTVGSYAPAVSAAKADYYKIALTNINKYLKPQLTATKNSQSEEDLKLLQSYYRSLKIHMSKITDAKQKAAISKMLMELSQDIVAVTKQVKAQVAANDAVEAFELAALDTAEDVAKAEELYNVALDKVQDITDRTVRVALMNRLNDKKAKLDAAKKTVEDVAATIKAAEDAVKAYEDFQITKYEDVAKAKELAKAATDAVAKVTDEAKKTALTTRITEQDKKVAEKEAELAPIEIKGVAAIGASKIKVTFTKAVDTTKATVSVKKSNIPINYSNIEWNEAKTEATITMISKLTAGDYVVSVSGLTTTNIEKTLTAENERVAKIEFGSANAVLDVSDVNNKTVKVTIKIYNQYNEDITSSVAALTVTSSAGTAIYASGTITITNATAFNIGDKISVSALEPTSATFASNVLTVAAKPYASEITITKLYNPDNLTLDVNSIATAFYVLVDARDQYGNVVPAANLKDDVEIIVTDQSKFKVANTFTPLTVDGNQVAALQLQGPLSAGTAKVMIISKFTGKSASFDVTVKDSAKADVITLNAPALAVAGEKFEVPFTAVDQFGNAITNASGLSNVVFRTSEEGVTAGFEQDYVKNVVKLVVDATSMTSGKTIILMVTTPTGKFVQLPITVQAPAKPVVITGIKDISTKIAKDGSVNLAAANIVVKDQYGRDKSLPDGYKFVFETSDSSKVALENPQDTSVTLNALAKGSSTLTIKLQQKVSDVWTDVQNSVYTFTATVVDKTDFVSYELGQIAKVYADGATHAVPLTVYGVMADGTKVALPSKYYNVLIINDQSGNIAFNKGKIEAANAVAVDSTTNEAKATALVTIEGNNGPVVLNGDIIVTKAAPVVTSLYLASSTNTTVEDATNNVVSVAKANIDSDAKVTNEMTAILKANDQYGVGITPTILSTYITNLPSGKTINQVVPGDTFNVIIVEATGKTMTVKVIVK